MIVEPEISVVTHHDVGGGRARFNEGDGKRTGRTDPGQGYRDEDQWEEDTAFHLRTLHSPGEPCIVWGHLARISYAEVDPQWRRAVAGAYVTLLATNLQTK
jgi:hypothetical protein